MPALLYPGTPTRRPFLPSVGTVVAPPAPAIAAQQTALFFAAVQGTPATGTQTVGVTNGGSGTLGGLAVGVVYPGAGGWLTATLNTATAPATITVALVAAVAAGLPPQTYTATVRITSTAPGVTNSPQDIPVSFAVLAAPAVALLAAPAAAALPAETGLYSSADLVQRCRDAAQLPDDDEMMTDAVWYRLLTAAQQDWVARIAAHVPRVLYSAPRLLTSDDGGESFRFGLDVNGRPVVPLGEILVFRSQDDATRPDWGGLRLRDGVDFIADGDRLRFRRSGRRPSWTDGGPWVRYIAPAGVIDAVHQPTLLPVYARELLVLSAVERWARQGGLRDPSPYVAQAEKVWSGDPSNPADVGMLGALRQQFDAPGRVGRGGASGARLPGSAFWGTR